MSSQDVVDFVNRRLESGVTKLSAICEEVCSTSYQPLRQFELYYHYFVSLCAPPCTCEAQIFCNLDREITV